MTLFVVSAPTSLPHSPHVRPSIAIEWPASTTTRRTITEYIFSLALSGIVLDDEMELLLLCQYNLHEDDDNNVQYSASPVRG